MNPFPIATFTPIDLSRQFNGANVRRFSTTSVLLFLALLVLPVLALRALTASVEPRILLAYCVLMPAVTFLLYRHDKRRAQAGGWRTPEKTLHLFDLLGGWPGGYIAQRSLRHKTAKRSFQIIFWSIVVLHQLVAFDSLHHWHYTRQAFSLIPI